MLPFVIDSQIQDLVDSRSAGYRRESMKIIGFLSKRTMADLTKTREDYFGQRKNVRIAESDGYELWRFSAAGGLEQSSYALQTPEQYVFLMSKAPSKFFKWRVIPFASHLYPELIRIYATSLDLLQVLSSYQESLERSLFCSSVVMKRLFGERFTDVHFGTDRLFEDAFRIASTRGSWVDYIQVYDESKKHVVLSVSRDGRVTVRRGSFAKIFEAILLPLAEQANKKYNFMNHRERQSQPQNQIKPFLLSYDEPLFDKREVVTRLRNVIESYTYCYYTVVHSGNPYLYIMISDTLDNSAFSVRTSGDRTIMVVPQVRATPDSLVRFHRFLSEQFREGRLEEPTAAI
jgi:hypothetical protein